MYRYSQQMRGGIGATKLRQKLTQAALVILVIAVVVLGIVAQNALGFVGREQTQYSERMRSEVAQAITQVNSLSRTGGSTTTNMLGKIRQHVYAMEVIQNIHVALRGTSARLVEESAFKEIYTVIDVFDDKLQTGQQTKEPQSQLSTLLNNLQTTVNSAPQK